jgi:aspartokinase-like uncharacterized kinase
MDHVARLHLVGSVTYYRGWIALLCGGLVHVNIARGHFTSMSLSQRNLFELAVVCFVISMASEIRARDAVGKEISGGLRKAA